MARLIIEHNGKRYRPYIVKDGMCTGKRTCALYDGKRCKEDSIPHRWPCIPILNAIDRCGLQNAYTTNFKEVK